MPPRPSAGLPEGPAGIGPGADCDALLTASACERGRMLALAVVGVADCGVCSRADVCVGVPADGIPTAAAAAMAVFRGAGIGCVPGSILTGGAGC
jgi:hypothetical protein